MVAVYRYVRRDLLWGKQTYSGNETTLFSDGS